MKYRVLLSLEGLNTLIEEKIYLLRAIDRDSRECGCYELSDQFVTFTRVAEELGDVINRSMAIVPHED